MSKPLISIVIPVYKGTFLHDAIRSILNQTYSNLEVIIVNDCSPNDIDSIVGSFTDSRLKYYINETNLGGTNPVNNWNKCLSYVTGEYFSLLCDDDIYEEDFIMEMYSLAQKYPNTNVFRCRGCIIDGNKNKINYYPSSPEWETTKDYMWHVFNNYRYQTISEFMYRTDAVRRIGGYATLPLAWYADYLSIYKFSLDGGIASSSKPMMYFRQSGLNISSQDNKNTGLKLLATKLYIEETDKLIERLSLNNEEAVWLKNLLRYRSKVITKYSLNCTSRKDLLRIFYKHKYYNISPKMLIKAFFHRK